MYFHPFLVNATHTNAVATTIQELAHVWMEGINRQYRLRMEAINGLCQTQLDNIQALFESSDGTPYVADLAYCIAPAPSQVMEVAMRSGEITSDIHRQVVDLLQRLATELTVQFAGADASPGHSLTEAVPDKAIVKRKKRGMKSRVLSEER